MSTSGLKYTHCQSEEERLGRSRERRLKWYYKNREKTKVNKKLYDQEFFKLNKQDILEKNRDRYQKNKDRYKNKITEYRLVNKDKINAQVRLWSKTEAGKMSRLNNQTKRYRNLKSNNSDITKDWLVRLKSDTIYCCLCRVKMTNKGSDSNGKQLDHIIPICIGGLHIMNNVRFICKICNLKRPKDGSDITGQI